MDNLVFEEAVNAEIDTSEFISKKWLYVNDSNSQNYTSQVVIDSTPLANSGGWINWAEGYILMPLVVQLKSNTPANLPIAGANKFRADHSWAFKAGFWHMINSMTLEFNNQNCVQQTPFLNVFRSFKAHTSFSQDDLYNHGSTIGYYPDNAGSWSFNNDNATITNPLRASGVGLCNNKQVPVMISRSPVVGGSITQATPIYSSSAFSGLTLGAGTTLPSIGASNPSGFTGTDESCNSGFAKRSCWNCYSQDDALNQDAINDQASSNTVFRSSRLLGAEGNIGWQVYAKLRLKDLSDFFQKCPLLKGSTIRFYINTNQTSISFTTTAGVIDAAGAFTTFPTIAVNSVSVLGGLTNPLMIASADVGQGLAPLPADTYTLSVNIFKTTDGTLNSNLQSCRLYAPVYKMNPLAEQRYLQLAPTKKIEYRDIFQYQFNDIASLSSFNLLVTNGIANIQSVLVIPFLSTTANGTAYNTLLSPTSPSGGVPDPIILTNFNILVSGVNLFLNNQFYDYEVFNQELKSSNQLNGNLTTGLSSGLINEDMFSRGYRYYYGNCSRILPSEEGVSRSIQIQGQNASKLACNLMVFVEFKRSIVVDIATGARLE